MGVNSLIQHARLVQEPPHGFEVLGRRGVERTTKALKLLWRHLELCLGGNQLAGHLEGIRQDKLRKCLVSKSSFLRLRLMIPCLLHDVGLLRDPSVHPPPLLSRPEPAAAALSRAATPRLLLLAAFYPPPCPLPSAGCCVSGVRTKPLRMSACSWRARAARVSPKRCWAS